MDFRFNEVIIRGGFLHDLQELNRKVTINAVYDRFADTGRFSALDCAWKEGDEIKPHIFWDSDVAKWLESAAYILAKHPDAALEEKVERAIDAMEAHQWEDGYLNSYYTAVEPENRFTNRDHHELYCCGHLIEAAVAYYEATGKDRFLHMMEKYVALVDRVFRVDHSAVFDTPGHEEIELALVRLYRCTGKKQYLDLAAYFVNTRGTSERDKNVIHGRSYHYLGSTNYAQSIAPVREQLEADGHAVRAMYLYCAMADLYAETGDETLREAALRLFADATEKKMHITGGLGSIRVGEAFTHAYDLPAERTYNETCASIGMIFFAQRLREVEQKGVFADVVERQLYNGMLSGISLDGKSFFYGNPLEVNLKNHTRTRFNPKEEKYPITQRVEVFKCSCCPPNLTRLFASLERYLYHRANDVYFVDQFAESSWCENGATVTQHTDYPQSGRVSLSFIGVKTAAVRIPGWCDRYTCNVPVTVKDGYAYLEDPTEVEFNFEMKPVYYSAHAEVDESAGKVALMRGPIVYCAERIDNPVNLHRVLFVPEMNATEERDPLTGLARITVDALISAPKAGGLFQKVDNVYEKTRISLIPYYAFANRGESDMLVWFRYKD
ncbi:MAG: glycoside hydrolase family 127 protein [Clostridia bacterium]|nr:glycoside hydrolase family 127 protein [Clostridia bacterium]